MRICVHVSQFYDWEPVPDGVEVKPIDVQQKRVKPAAGGGWLMRVKKVAQGDDGTPRDTHTDVQMPEREIVATIVQDMVRDKVARSRSEAVCLQMSRHVMPNHAHKNWMKAVELDDDGPDTKTFDDMVAAQVVAGNIETESVAEMRDLYLAKSDVANAVRKHFGIAEVSP